MKRMFKKLTALLVLPLFFFLLSPVQVFGTENDPYDFTIRIYAGNQGSFDGNEVITETYDYNEPFSFDMSKVQVKDGSKYYIRGLKEAGKDNDYTILPSFTVTEDRDLVVAYGILKDAIEYTVYYVDADTGEALADSVKFYGNVGDRPVLSHIYFEGYQPQAYNLTGTLTSDPSHNVFTFRYRKVPTPAPSTPAAPNRPSAPSTPSTTAPSRPTTAPNSPLPDTGADTGNNQTDNDDNDREDEDTDNEAANDNDENEEDNTSDNTEGSENNRPNQLEDIDDPDVPLSGPGEEDVETDPNAVTNADKRSFFTPLNIILILIIIGAIGGFAFLIFKKKDLDHADDTVDYNIIDDQNDHE